MIYAAHPFGAAMLQDELLTTGVMWRRVFAWLVDIALLTLLVGGSWIFCIIFGVLTFGLGWPLAGVLPLAPLLYHWLFLASPMSATPGQALLGLVVRRNDDLGQPTLQQALAFTVLFYITLALGVIWMGVALFTVRHRTFHDMISGLVVIRARALTAPLGFWNMGGGNRGAGGPSAA